MPHKLLNYYSVGNDLMFRFNALVGFSVDGELVIKKLAYNGRRRKYIT